MICQLHAQNPTDSKETMFLLQSDDLKTQDDSDEWLASLKEYWKDRSDNPGERDPIPDGWQPMVCDETADCFVRAPVAT
jgi:hypothetical protein